MPGVTLSPLAAALFLLLSLLAGGLIGWLLARLRSHRGADAGGLGREEVEANYVHRQVHDRVQQEADLNYENLQEKITREQELLVQNTSLQQQLAHLRTRQNEQAAETQRLQEASLAHFERAADRLFQEKSQRLTAENARQLGHLLTPLRERLQGFEQQVERRFVEETRDRVTLRQEIKSLQQLNQRISDEANNLAGALRGSAKTQGDWGEWQLLTLLQSSGLQDGVHFRSQSSFRDDEAGGRQKRPDFIINLPDDKHLVIDSKVSLTAYERHCAHDANDPAGQRRHAADHLRSLRGHIADLASKNYTRLYQINSPDYLLLFVPIEPAFGLALQTDRAVFTDALERNIVIVTPSTLLATLRTVSYIWKQENQKKNVLEIARQSGLLYDKFVAFTEDLDQIGHRLRQAQQSYEDAYNKLSRSGKYGTTLVGRAERLRELGARTRKSLPNDLLEASQLEEE